MAQTKPSDGSAVRSSKTIRLRRTIVTKTVQERHLEVPQDYDPREWLVNDEHGLREQLIAEGRKMVQSEWAEDDELQVMSEGENL